MALPASGSNFSLPTLKVVILGDLGVGKTCLRSQFVHHVFTNAYKATIGGDYLTATIEIEDRIPDNDKQTPLVLSETHVPVDLPSTKKVNLQIWDTAGQERFNLISKAFYRGADVAILVYDVTNYESLLSTRDWFDRFLEHCHVERPGVVLVGNKIDKSDDRCIDHEEVPDVLSRNTSASIGRFVQNWHADLLEVTCKKLDAVEQVFRRVAEVGLTLAPAGTQSRSIVDFDGIALGESIKLPVTNCAC